MAGRLQAGRQPGDDKEFRVASPLPGPADISIPLLIRRGANDPRVKPGRVGAIVAALRRPG